MTNQPNKRAPHPMDIHVGSRVRLRRMMKSMSQDMLGRELGLTFQQVQKYEKGTNRIGASRLFDIARILEVPVQFFYDDFGKDGELTSLKGAYDPSAEDKGDFLASLATPDGMELSRAFSALATPVRRRVLDLVKELADDPDDGVTPPKKPGGPEGGTKLG